MSISLIIYIPIILLITSCFNSNEHKNKNNDISTINLADSLKIKFLITQWASPDTYYKIIITDSIYSIKWRYGKIMINDKFIENAEEVKFTLTTQQIDSIKYLSSHIDNQLHIGITGVIDSNLAGLWINGHKIFYTSLFYISEDMDYCQSLPINKLITYLLYLSPMEIDLINFTKH